MILSLLVAAAFATPLPPTPLNSVTPPFPEDEYGPVHMKASGTSYKEGYCPNIPTSFLREYRVSSWAELETALSQVQPGEAIILAPGEYTERFIRKDIRRGGTPESPIYIISENLHQAHVKSPEARWHLYLFAPNLVISGLRGHLHFEVYRANIRIACNWLQGMNNDDPQWTDVNDELMNMRPSAGFAATDFEFDNNVIENYSGGIINQQCSGCLQNARAHIHHNRFGPTPGGFPNGSEALFWGLSNAGQNDGRLEGVIENNHFLDWNNEAELISLKSSANIVRHNCVDVRQGMINNRGGNDNMVYSNYIISTGGYGYMRNARYSSVWAFNIIMQENNRFDYITTYPEYVGDPYSASDDIIVAYNVLFDPSNTRKFLWVTVDNLPYDIERYTERARVSGNLIVNSAGYGLERSNSGNAPLVVNFSQNTSANLEAPQSCGDPVPAFEGRKFVVPYLTNPLQEIIISPRYLLK